MTIAYKLQDAFLAKLFSSRFAEDFYLTGGTALARFYFHHRESIDLDLFTQNQKIDFNEVNLMINRFYQEIKLKIVKQVTTNTFIQYIGEDKNRTAFKVDFVKDISVHFGKIIKKEGVRIDSIENIGCNKILAIFGRTDPKDFIDLFFILKKTKFSFDHLYKLAQRKDLGLSEFYFAHSIANIDKIETWPKVLIPFNREKLIKFYQDLSIKILLELKPKK